MKTFYYKGSTYQIPNDQSYDAFYQSLKNNSFVATLKMLKNHSVAPFYIEEETETVMMRIEDVDQIFPVDSYVLSREEYLQLLKLRIEEQCEGCIHYENAKQNPKLCERRMCLDGKCFYYLPQKKFFLKVSCDAFWKEFSDISDNLINLLSKNKMVFAKNQVMQLYRRYINARAYMALNYVDDKPVLMLSGLSDNFIQILNEFLISRSPKEIQDKWLLFSYLPKDIYEYIPTNPDYDVNALYPRIAFKEVDADRARFEYEIVIYDTDLPDVRAYYENYRYLCSKIGENLLLNSAYDWAFCFESDQTELYSAKEIYEMLVNYYGKHIAEKYSRHCNSFSYRFESFEHALIRGDSQTSRSYCSELTFKMALYSPAPTYQSAMDILNLTCAYIEIDKSEENIAYLRNHLSPVLTQRGICMMIGYESGKDKFYMDYLVTDVALMKQKLRDLSVEFKKLNAVYTEIMKEGRISYTISFDMDSVKDGELKKLN